MDYSGDMVDTSAMLPALVRRWQIGWGLSRGLPTATDDGEALRVELGLPNRYREIIALTADTDPQSVYSLASEAARDPQRVWLTVPTCFPQTVEVALKTEGLRLFDGHERMMTARLTDNPTRDVPGGYTISTEREGALIRAVVRHRVGVVAARGIMALTGTDAIAHNIHTVPSYRRMGLASALMSALCRVAIAAGAVTGILIASPQGEQLYTALGWSPVAAVVAARNS